MAAPRRFNPNLPFGEVYGMPGVAYEQRGQNYNSAKLPVDENGKLLAGALPPDPPPAAPAANAAKKGQKKPATAPVIDEDTPEDEKPLDLEGWIAGTKNYDFVTVKAYVSEITQEMPKSREEVEDLAARILNGEFSAQQ
jgi:hypothetical protein